MLKQNIQTLNKIHSKNLFFIFLLLNVSFAIIMSLIPSHLNIEYIEPNEPSSLLLLAIVAPIIETLLVMTLPIILLYQFTKNNVFIIIFNASIFALTHFDSLFHIVNTFIGGFLMNLLYTVILTKYPKQEGKGHILAFSWVALMHSVYNLIGYFLIEVLRIL